MVKAGFLEKFYNNGFVGLRKCTRGEVLIDEQSLLKELCRDTRISRREVGIGYIDIMTRAWDYAILPMTAPAEYLAMYAAYYYCVSRNVNEL